MSKRALSSVSAVAVIAFVLAFAGAPTANAALIDVLVETTPGSGTFDVLLGQVQSFDDSSNTAAQSYNLTNFRYAGDEISPTPNVSQIFFVENTNGLNVYWVHSGIGGGAGTANTTLSLMDPLNNNPTMSILVEDDASGGSGDVYSAVGDNFNAVNDWVDNFSDGWVVGSLNSTIGSGWMLLANFNSSTGITGFQATGTSTSIDLATQLGNGAQVKFQIRDPSQIPEPGTIALFGLGLVGLFGLRRKQK